MGYKAPITVAFIVISLLAVTITYSQFTTQETVAKIRFIGTYSEISLNVTPELQSIGVVGGGDFVIYEIIIENPTMRDLSIIWQLDNAHPSNTLPASAILRINDVDWFEGEERSISANSGLMAQVIVFIIAPVDPELTFFDFAGEITFKAVIVSP